MGNKLENMQLDCMMKAEELIRKGYVKDVDIFQLTDTLIALELEKIEKNAKSDKHINYNDEIVEIEEVGELETTDISVSGDNLFYCNGILTKNSFGLPATSDLMIALISTEQLEKSNQIMVKQLKNRYNDVSTHKRFTVGIDRSKMRLYDIADPLANITVDSPGSSPVVSTPFNSGKKQHNFSGLKV
jgi:superfamily II DNA or RNA helicase